ncbi:MAG: hypothetical protein QXQ70_08525 [Candidatus Caldarchaeum sp.]
MNSTVSALLTVLVLLAGFSAASLAYVNVYTVKAAELRESQHEADAANELLHAYIYRDVNTNASLLTLRNAGKTALEITDVMLVDRSGNVVKVVRLNETIKLSPQQYRTMPFAVLAGPEYGNYTEAFDSLSAAYFKTFRGRVFGSRYLAPPVVEVAAYKTYYTTQTTQLTSTDTPDVIETTITLTSSSVTVIIDNPSLWPVYVYPGIAYPRGAYRKDVNFPSWGLLPGLQAKYWDNRIRNVTNPSDIKIPMHVSCWTPFSGWNPNGWTFISIWRPAPVSALGPTFAPVDINYFQNYATCSKELFFPESSIVNVGIGDYYYDTFRDTVSTGNLTGTGTISIPFPEDRYPVTVTKITITVYSDTCWQNRRKSDGRCVLYQFDDGITSPVNLKISTTTFQNVRSASAGANIVLENQAPLTVSYNTLQNNTIKISADYTYRVSRNYVDINFPTSISWYSVALEDPSVYIRDIHKLAYVAVVDLWNTTNIIAYSTTGVLRVNGTGPLGIVAVYTYDRTIEHVPRPPPPPEQPCLQGYSIAVCFSIDALKAGQGGYSGAATTVPCGSPPPSLSPTIYLPNSGCEAYITPGPGTYDPNQLPKCSKQGNQATCSDVPYGKTVVVDCNPNE